MAGGTTMRIPMVATAVIGAAGLLLIQESEGKRNESYKDAVGVWTICYGHTGPEVKAGMYASDRMCNVLLDRDIRVHLDGLRPCINVPVNQNQQDAILSLTFNAGVYNICHSTLVRKLNAGDYAGAGREFARWKYAKGKALPGLAIRREREMRLYATQPTPSAGPASTASLRALLKGPQ